jgi:hypothetical protein
VKKPSAFGKAVSAQLSAFSSELSLTSSIADEQLKADCYGLIAEG